LAAQQTVKGKFDPIFAHGARPFTMPSSLPRIETKSVPAELVTVAYLEAFIRVKAFCQGNVSKIFAHPFVKGVGKGGIMKADHFAQAVQVLLYAPV
jgi:hypothetical protein